MAGVDVPISPSPGVMLALRGRLCNMVVNRLHRSGDGDIIVPQRALSIVGTSSWTVDDPEELDVPEDHVRRMYEEGVKLIPAVATGGVPRGMVRRPAADRLARRGGHGPRALAHVQDATTTRETDGVEGFLTITGGKATTLRGMAELCADAICRKLGVEAECRTRETVLLPHTELFAA